MPGPNDISKQVQSSYERLVDAYAARNDQNTPAKLLPLAHRLLSHMGDNGRLLDAGCGTGRELRRFESQGANVCGIDLSLGMLRYARATVSGDLLAMNLLQLGFQDASFEAIWCCASLLHLQKSQAHRALSELHRVLKRNGMLVLIVQEGTGEAWEDSYVQNAPRYFARYEADELKRSVRNAGFCIDEAGSMDGRDRDWLYCVCVRE